MIKRFFSSFGFAGHGDTLGKLGSKLNNSLFIALTSIGTIILGFGGALAGGYTFDAKWQAATTTAEHFSVIAHYPIAWMYIGGLLVLIGSIGTYLDSNTLKEQNEKLLAENSGIGDLKAGINSAQETTEILKSSLRKLHTELVTTHLKAAYRYIGLSTHDRISIYYEHGNEFYLLARYSQNPEYAKSHRQKFALNQGVIGKAWQHQRHVERHCPSFEKKAEYIKHMSETYGFKEDQLLGFAMKSCRYVAVAISDADSHTGVIVFESTDDEFLQGYNGEIEGNIFTYCLDYQGIHSKFLRDGLDFNRELHIKSAPPSVEQDFLHTFKKGAAK